MEHFIQSLDLRNSLMLGNSVGCQSYHMLLKMELMARI